MNKFTIITAVALAAIFSLNAISTAQAGRGYNGMNMQGMNMQGTSYQGEGAAVIAVTLPSGETVVLH